MASHPLKKIPLVITTENRDETTSKDAKLVNCYMEKTELGEYFVVKRPGLQAYSSVTAGAGSGIFQWNGDIYSIFGTTFYKNGVSVGTVDGTGGIYRFDVVPITTYGGKSYLIFGNGVTAYTYDSTGTLTEIPAQSTTSTTGNTTAGSAIISGIPSTAGWAANYKVADTTSGTVIPVGSYILTVDSATQITINQNALAAGTGVALNVTSQGIPKPFVKGWAYLDQTLYIGSLDQHINGSELGDPTTWQPLNVVTAQIDPDKIVGLGKQLVYVIAFKQKSVEVFYDAANSTGSPLSAVQGAKVNFGCATIESVQGNGGVLTWIASKDKGSRFIASMEGLAAKPVSGEAIDRIIQASTLATVYSWGANISGHQFYVLTLTDKNVTLVYDSKDQGWAQWTDSSGGYLPIVDSTTDSSGNVLCQHATNGKIYKLLSTQYSDDGSIIPLDIITPNWDGGTQSWKILERLFVEADRNEAYIRVSKSDDDYKTWSNPRWVNLANKRPYLNNCGSFYRRAYWLHHEADSAFRIKALSPQVLLGTK